MAIRFIRRPSDKPTITNADDARSIRYAYGGQDGFVQHAGTELSSTVNANRFTINSGIVVLQGWESEIDSNGWSITVENVSTKKYYSIYYEVNLAMQTAEIISVYDVSDYPEIDPGDDLTAVQTGIARLLLYRFTAQNGVISDVSKEVPAILFLTLASNRPPIKSISIPEIVFAKPGIVTNPGDVINSATLFIVTNTSYPRIGYFPNGANNSIASVEFEYILLKGDNVPFEYALTSDGSFYCYALEAYNELLAGDTLQTDVKVTATIEDIYGNTIKKSWIVKGARE